MRVLLTNLQLTTNTGTEIVVRDLALGLRRRGHDVAVYTPSAGEPAARLISDGIPVVTALDDVPFLPDVVHGHHHTPTVAAIEHFPDVPVVWVCHDRVQYEDIPPMLPAVRRYVAVDLNCRERLVAEHGIDATRVELVHNAVDVERFRLRAERMGPPRRALVFSNQARHGGWLDLVQIACDERGIALDVVGAGVDTSTTRPEELLQHYDVVFGKARCALEALASGCAVVLVDQPGFGGLVTTSDMSAMRDWNFGARCLQVPTTAALVGAALDALDATDARQVSHWVRTIASLDAAVDRYLQLYAAAIDTSPAELDGDPLRSVLAHAGRLERRLRVSSVPGAGQALPPGVNRGLRITVDRTPGTMRAGDTSTLDVTLHNASTEVLCGAPPHPVVLAHHWRGPHGATIEGPRTALPAPLHPGGSVHLPMTVHAPAEEGDWRLTVTLVQELVAWHDALDPPLAAVVDVTVHDGRPDTSLSGWLRRTQHHRTTPVHLERDADVRTLAFADDIPRGALVYATSAQVVERAVRDSGLSAVITTAELADLVPAPLGLVASVDPTRAFYELHNALARHTTFYGARPATTVHPTATVDPGAHLDPTGVIVGAHCRIHAGAVVRGTVVLGEGVVVEPGAVVGAAGFQTSARHGNAIDLVHAGGVVLGDHTHVHANAVIAAGPFDLPTEVGSHCQIGNGAFVSHRCRLGHHVYIGHNATVNGRVDVGDGAWVGPGAVIAHRVSLGDGCAVALGSTVITDVAPGAKVSGLPAGDQHTMFRHAVSLRTSDR